MPKHPDLTDTALADDEAMLPEVVAAVQVAGRRLRDRFSPDSRPGSRDEAFAALRANDAASLAMLRGPLERARPGARWAEEELEGGALPPGEWWVTDPVEGNINHVHGTEDWGVTATLVRENAPVLAAVYLPMTGATYTAVRGGGAYENGVRLRASTKTAMDGALVGTSQARPDEDEETLRRLGASVEAMARAALLVRVSVPATLHLTQVAAGRMDAFWQHTDVRLDHLAGALLVAEAGGTVSDTRGRPWGLTSNDFLATAPGLHAAAVNVLSAIA